MPKYNYLIIGGGMTADSAVQGIREVDAEGTIGLVSADPHPPYNRPPLSKGLWKGMSVEKIWRETEKKSATLHLHRRATNLDPARKQVTDEKGETYTYEKLLIATGGAPRRLPNKAEGVTYYRTFDNFQKLRGVAERGVRFGVIGGGFIGSEMAAALAMNDSEVVMIFPGGGIGGLQFPGDLSKYLNDYYRQKGVQVLAGHRVTGLEDRGEKVAITTNKGEEILVDHVVAGIGITPNVALAEQAGIDVDDGIVVDEFLGTNQADIYAAGDVASFHSPHLGRRIRVEHEDNANTMGRISGLNMAGKRTPYNHLPMFYSDLFDHGYEAVGLLDSRLETVADWKQQYEKGVVYYLEGERVRGVLLWNVWDMVDTARELIAEPGPFSSEALKGRI